MQDFQTLIETSDYLCRSSSSLFNTSLLSTLWMGNHEETPISAITIHETQVDFRLKICISDLHDFKLNLQITPETVLIQGQPTEEAIVEGYFRPNGFESLIPLPYPVKPESYWTEIKQNILTIQVAKQLDVQPSKVRVEIPTVDNRK